jgi:two-component system, cell cycle response regulator
MLAPPDGETGQKWRQKLDKALQVQIIETSSEREAANLGLLERPDVFVVHHSLSEGGDGLRLVSALRARTETRHSAIILIVGPNCLAVAAQGLELGASDYIMEPFDMNELVARLRSQMRRKRLSDQLRTNMRDGLKMAVIDPLTGLFNRRYATQHMSGIIERAKTAALPFAVMIMDLDRFKSINDRWGHDAGDAVLTEFSRRLRENVRGVDLVARLGGEEFLLVMPDTSSAAAAAAAERVRRAVELVPFSLRGGDGTTNVTVSIGAVMSGEAAPSAECLIRLADEALYASKAQGRNRVSFARIAA